MKLIKFRVALFAVIVSFALFASRASAELCSTVNDMDSATRSALEHAALQFGDAVVRGDAATLRQNAIASLASNFAGAEALINDSKAAFSGGQATIRATYLLDATGGPQVLDHAEFLCGIWGTPQFVSFSLNSLPAAKYGLVIEDVKSPKGPYLLSFILQQEGGAWKLAGLPPPKPSQLLGHDAPWYLTKAREYKAKGETHNAWFYYQQARNLVTPVSFISFTPLIKLDKEAQQSQPADLPLNGPVNLTAANGKTYKVTEIFPVIAENGMDLVVKYSLPDVSNTAQTFQENTNVIKTIATKYPEYRETFAGIVARAVAPNGQDYGTLLAMKDIQ
ncbi:MAG TPA: hypothetical protein VK699_12690 [Terriglobales bacterium]|jgi:hypothetical protein|nr:hypothetical protein [Terriglobales bacterium]